MRAVLHIIGAPLSFSIAVCLYSISSHGLIIAFDYYYLHLMTSKLLVFFLNPFKMTLCHFAFKGKIHIYLAGQHPR